MNRRAFLKTSGSVLGAAALGAAVGAADKKRSLKKAIMYSTIGVKGSVLEKFQAVKAAGFEGVEPMSHMNQEEVKAALASTGLKPASVCCATHWDNPLSDPSPAVREKGLEGLQQALR